MASQDGIIIKQSEHLSSFAIDKEKIDFYKQAKPITEKLQKSERLRAKLLSLQKDRAQKVDTNQEKAKEKRRNLSVDFNYKRKELEKRSKIREDAISAVREVKKIEIDTSKEIRQLKK